MLAADRDFARITAGGSVSRLPTRPWQAATPAERLDVEHCWRTAVGRGDAVRCRFQVLHDDGWPRWVELTATPERDPHGRIVAMNGVVVDDTTAVERQLTFEHLAAVIGDSSDAVVLLDGDGRVVYANRRARELTGHLPAAATFDQPSLDVGRDDDDDGHDDGDDTSGFVALLESIRVQMPRDVLHAPGSSRWTGEVVFRSPAALEHLLDVDVVIRRDHSGRVEHWGAVVRDVTGRANLHQELLRQATHDGLTGLPNRLLLLRATADAIERVRGSRDRVAMLFCDLDNLKDVNDTVGHDVGDALLAHVAGRIASAVRPSDVIARIGGDEFVVLCEGIVDEHDALDVAERIRSALTGRIQVRDVEVDVAVSIGVALGSADTLDEHTASDAALTLLRQADQAMYTAKRRGRGRVELFTDVMRTETIEQRRLAAELERAVVDQELHIAYLPIVSTQTGRIVGAEALLRWEHPTRGALRPAQFLHLAEESGTIVPLGRWVIDTACRDAASWLAQGLVDRLFSVHVNVAARQLADDGFVEQVLGTLRHHDLVAAQLTLDLAEETVIGAQGTTLRSLRALRRHGVHLALDDFGVGAASITALRGCGADLLKLDGAMARRLGSSEDDPIIRAVVQLAHALDMRVVAEWVVSADQFTRLRSLGCDMVQGYLYGEPVGAAEFARARAGELARRRGADTGT